MHRWVAVRKDLINLSILDQQMKSTVHLLTAQSWFSNRPVKPQSPTPTVLCQVLYKARTIQSQLPGAHDMWMSKLFSVRKLIGFNWHYQARGLHIKHLSPTLALKLLRRTFSFRILSFSSFFAWIRFCCSAKRAEMFLSRAIIASSSSSSSLLSPSFCF